MEICSSTDAYLWNLAVHGQNEEACCELVNRHRDTVWRVCSQILLSQDEADEACQVTFLAMPENGEQIKSADFSPWLYRVTYRASLRVRKETLKHTPQSSSPLNEPAEVDWFSRIEQAERDETVLQAVDALPEKFRSVMVLHYVRGLTRDEIAGRLSISNQAVKGRLSKGRSLLRSRLMKKGISLAVIGACLHSKVQAVMPETIQQPLLAATHTWVSGNPVDMSRVPFSDLNKKEFGMNCRNLLNSKWTIACLVILATCTAFFAGRTASTGNVIEGWSESGGDQHLLATVPEDPQQSDYFDQEPSPFMLASTEEPVAVVAFPQATPTSFTPTAMAPDEVAGTTRGNSTPAVPAAPFATTAAATQAFESNDTKSTRGLPQGSWHRRSALGEITSRVDGSNIAIEFSIAELGGLAFDVKAEHSIASDGTIYGLVHSINLDIPPILAAESDFEELAVFTMLNDLPFSMRVYSDDDSVTIKDLTIGVPFDAQTKDALSVETLQEVKLMFLGTFQKSDK